MSDPEFIRYLSSQFSRRDFLQFLGLGMAGLLLPKQIGTRSFAGLENSLQDGLLGRITQSGYQLHKAPDEKTTVVREMEQDSLLQITGVTVSESETSPNRIWYELDGTLYGHSRRIQPVKRHFNAVDTAIPEDGCLGEITVPYVDAYNSMDSKRSVIYRFYYASTFWILNRIKDQEGSIWYQLLDDRTYGRFYVPAYYVRLVPDSELTAISPEADPEVKKIIVDLSAQSMTAYEGDRIVYMSRISSGVRLKEGGFATPKGIYRITRKRPCRHMANPANAYGSGFDLPGVPWVSYFTSDGVAFHGAYWHNDFGVPHSHGCINMTPQAAKWVYRWTTPSVPSENYYYADTNGTRVIVQ